MTQIPWQLSEPGGAQLDVAQWVGRLSRTAYESGLADWEPVGIASRWRASALSGLLSGSYATLVISLAARRVGGDAAVVWSNVGTVLLRGRAAVARPTAKQIAAGILVHQAADWLWAQAFFGLGPGRARARQRAVFGLMLPWAVATSAAEYYLILPWLQPLVPMEVPYWLALLAHVSSVSSYPAFLGLYRRLRWHEPLPRTPWLWGTPGVLAVGALALALFARLDRAGLVPYWPFAGRRGRAQDRRFLRRMTSHHVLGVRLARQAATRGRSHDLRVLGRLMIAAHNSELDVMRSWWRHWFGGEMPPVSQEVRQEMYGMPAEERVRWLDTLEGETFDQEWIPTMIYHHQGALKMCNEEWQHGGDPRLRLFTRLIYHSQLHQIRRMEELLTPERRAHKKELVEQARA